MTVTSNNRRFEYQGNGTAKAFPGPRLFAASDLDAYLVDATTEVPVLLSPSSYTVTGMGAAATVITLDVAPPVGQTLLLLRTVEYEQRTRFKNQGAFFPESHEDALDALEMQIQQLDDRFQRSVSISDTFVGVLPDLQLPSPDPLRPLVWSSDGTRLVNGDTNMTGDMLLRSSLANGDDDTKGAALVAFRQTGASAAARTTLAKLRERVTPQDFGAIGDGSANDFAAFSNALAAHEAITLPRGTYRLNANLTITKPITFEPGAVLQPGGGVTITINAPIRAGEAQIFNIANGLATVNGTFGGVDKRIAWWGATGDGTTDDSDELIAACTLGGRVIGKSGAVYKCTKSIELASDTDLDLNGSTIDGSAQASQGTHTRLLRAFGTYGTPVNLTSNANKGASTLATAAFTAVQGDLVIVFSQARFDPDRTNTRVGEMAIVRSVASGTITLEAPLRGTYNTADTAQVVKLSPKRNITIRGGTIIASTLPNTTTAVCAFEARVTKNVTVDGVIFRDAGQACVRLVDCMFPKVTLCSFEGSKETDNLAYGISCSNATQDALVFGNSAYNRRHFISTNNLSTDINQTGVVRRVKFQGNVLYRAARFAVGSEGDPLDTHAAAEDIEFLDNTVYGSGGTGVNFECASGVIRGNRFYNIGDIGINVHNESDYAGDIDISDNYIGGTGDYGILVVEGFNSDTGYRSVRVVNNTVHTGSAFTGINVFVDVPDADKPTITVSGNTVTSLSTGVNVSAAMNGVVHGNTIRALQGMSVGGVSKRMAINGNVIEVTGTAHRGILTQGLLRSSVSNNIVTMPAAAGQPAIDITNSGTNYPEGVVVSGNSANIPSAAGTGINLSNNATYCAVTGNVMRGFTTPVSIGSGTGHVNANNVV